MGQFPEAEELDLFVTTIGRVSRCEIAGEVICLAWTMRNRIGELRGNADASRDLVRYVCDELLEDIGMRDHANGVHQHSQYKVASVSAANGSGTVKRDLIAAYVRLVWEGLLPDPTNGASRAQHHEHASQLDRAWEPTALIGALLFFRRNGGSGKLFLSS